MTESLFSLVSAALLIGYPLAFAVVMVTYRVRHGEWPESQESPYP